MNPIATVSPAVPHFDWLALATPQNIGIAVAILTALWSLFKTYAKGSPSTSDDAIVERIERAKDWVERNAGLIWNIVETLSKSGALNGVPKLTAFLKILEEEHAAATGGKALPEEAIAVGKLAAKGMSAADKREKFTLDPPPAPASK